MIMVMDTDALRWFQLVADGYTVTEVSDVFGVSQSGVSRALARLEGDVGTPLLRRSGRVLRMTLAGVAFKRHVDDVVNHLDDGLAAVTELVDPESGTVSLAFPLSLGSWLVPRLVQGFAREHPGPGSSWPGPPWAREVRSPSSWPVVAQTSSSRGTAC